MSDKKLILSLSLGIIVLFGVFMFLTSSDEEPMADIVSSEIPAPTPISTVVSSIGREETISADDLVEDTQTDTEENTEETDTTVIIEPELSLAPLVEEAILPSLNDSDEYLKAELSAIDGGLPVLQYLVSEELIRKFVVMVENISRGEFPDRNRPVLDLNETMQVKEIGGEFYLMDEQSYKRFDNLIDALSNISTENAVNFYQQLLPLFEDACAELGLRNANFNELMFKAIENVTNAKTAAQAQQLKRPSINYLYADPLIENYTDVEKLLLRLGPENTEKLQRRLEFFKRRLELNMSLGN